MNTIGNPFAALSGGNGGGDKRNAGEIGQDDYLTLMMAQFQHQDPFKPMESGDFLGEIAQFGTVSGINDLQESFNQFAASLSSDQTLQASGLIDRRVLAATDFARLGAQGGQAGQVDVPGSSTAVTVDVTDLNGQLVRRLSYGAQAGGALRFEWDGLNARGERVPAGEYRFTAQAVGPTGGHSANVLLEDTVKSVSLSPDSGLLTLNFDALAPQTLRAVREIS